jgi:hypothetical protein
MKSKTTPKGYKQDILKLLNSAEQHFLSARREDILAINDVIEFLRLTLEGYDSKTGIAALSSLLTTIQLISNIVIKNVIDPLRVGEVPADTGEIVYMIKNFVDEEIAKFDEADPSDPRLQILWSIKEMLSSKKKQNTKKKIRKITIE